MSAVLPLEVTILRSALERIEWQVQGAGPAVCGICGGRFLRDSPAQGHKLGCDVAIALGRLPPLGDLQPGTPIPCPTCRELARRGVVGHPPCYDAWAKGEGETQTAPGPFPGLDRAIEKVAAAVPDGDLPVADLFGKRH